jgi:cytochrome c553
VLGGQRADYLLASLRAYQTGHRHSAVMGNAVAPLPPELMEPLAQRFARLPGIGGSHARTDDRLARQIIDKGLPERELPACVSCHTAGKRYPVLEGQKASFIAARLRRWRGDEETVDARRSHATMPVIARRIPEDLIDWIAQAYAAAGR